MFFLKRLIRNSSMRARLSGALILVSATPLVHGLDGQYDPTFAPGFGSRRLISVESLVSDFGNRLHIMGDGKLLMAGTCTGTLCLTRLLADGSDVDTTFHGDGKSDVAALAGAAFPSTCTLADMAVLSDGRIVLLASCTTVKVLIAVVTKNGLSMDATVGGGKGWIETDFGLDDSAPYAMKIQADGKVVIAGYAKDAAANVQYMAAARWLADFSALDPGFAGGSVRTVAFGTNSGDFAQARAVALQSNGGIVLAGFFSSQAALTRLLSDGTLDNDVANGFGAAHMGKVVLSFAGYVSSSLRAVVADGSDRLVFGGLAFDGGTSHHWLVDRVTTQGLQDGSFNGGSAQILLFPSGATGISADGPVVNALALQPDAKIIAVGTVFRAASPPPPATPGPTWWGAARFNQDGTLDSTFGRGGSLAGLQYDTFYDGPCCGFSDFGTAVAIGSGIVIAGRGSTSNFFSLSMQFGITRLTIDDYIFANSFE